MFLYVKLYPLIRYLPIIFFFSCQQSLICEIIVSKLYLIFTVLNTFQSPQRWPMNAQNIFVIIVLLAV